MKLVYKGSLPFKDIFWMGNWVRFTYGVPVEVEKVLGEKILRNRIDFFEYSRNIIEIEKAKKILIIRDGGIGDLIMLEPVLRELKNKGKDITLATDLRNFPIFFKKNIKLKDISQNLDVESYDIGVNLCGYVERPEFRTIHRTDAFADRLGLEIEEEKKKIPSINPKSIDDKFERPLVALCPVSTAMNRNLRLEFFLNLIERNPDIYFLILHSSKFLDVKEYNNCYDFQGKTDVSTLISLISKCDLVISADTGTMHIAGALKVPFITFFFPFIPETRLKYYENYSVFYPDYLDCCPCFRYECQDLKCHKELSVEYIEALMRKKLNIPLKKQEGVEVSIIIPAFNNFSLTKQCIENILENTLPTYEIILIDDNSNDETKDFFSNFQEKRLRYFRNEKNLGFLKSCNKGAELSDGKYLCFLNNDTKVGSGWLLKMLNTVKREKCITGASGGFLQKYGNKFFFRESRKDFCEPDYIEGWCLLTERELFFEVGKFDEEFGFGYSEDADFSFKAKEKGYKIIIPGGVNIEHLGSQTTKKKFGKNLFQLSEENNILLFQKWNYPERIVIKRSGAWGDVIMTIPAVKLLRKKYPKAEILYSTRCSAVLEGLPYLSQIIRFDSSVPSDAQIFNLEYEKEPLKNAIEVMISQVGCNPNGDINPELCCDEKNLFIEKILRRKRKSGKQIAVFHTGRSWKNREWSLEKFRKTIEFLQSKNFYCIEVGNRATQFTGKGSNFIDKLSIKELVFLIRNSDLFIGIDSFCSNIAQATRTKGVVIFGCVLPETRLLKNSSLIPVHLKDLECAGCRNKTSATYVECYRDRIYCCEDITTEMVKEKIECLI